MKLDATNYRRFAKLAVAAYNKKSMLVDALLWSQIVGHYERALREARKRGGSAGDTTSTP